MDMIKDKLLFYVYFNELCVFYICKKKVEFKVDGIIKCFLMDC